MVWCQLRCSIINPDYIPSFSRTVRGASSMMNKFVHSAVCWKLLVMLLYLEYLFFFLPSVFATWYRVVFFSNRSDGCRCYYMYSPLLSWCMCREASGFSRWISTPIYTSTRYFHVGRNDGAIFKIGSRWRHRSCCCKIMLLVQPSLLIASA